MEEVKDFIVYRIGEWGRWPCYELGEPSRKLVRYDFSRQNRVYKQHREYVILNEQEFNELQEMYLKLCENNRDGYNDKTLMQKVNEIFDQAKKPSLII